jgi:hypothetical protein
MTKKFSPADLGLTAKLPESGDEHRRVGPDDFDPIVEVHLNALAETTAKLDPLVREQYKNDPETLAEWDEIMQEFYDQYPEHGPVEH